MVDVVIIVIEKQVVNFDVVYGKCVDVCYIINVVKGEGMLNELLDFVVK